MRCPPDGYGYLLLRSFTSAILQGIIAYNILFVNSLDRKVSLLENEHTAWSNYICSKTNIFLCYTFPIMPDGAPVEGFEPRETIPQGKRVLRIPPGFAPPQRETVDTYHAVMHGPEEAHERGIVDQFTSRGFTTIQGGTFNASNPLEFGISYDSEAQHLRDRRLAAKLGIDMPHDFTPEAILASDAPVVVKDPASDRGQNKYLLETREQKIKFIAWALLKKQLGELYDSPQRNDIINRILTQVAEGNFEDAFINERGDIDRWIFEEYIDSPGDYNTSVRVVVDALGTIHYAQIARSDAKRGEQLPDASFDFSLLDEHGMLPGLPFSVFLTHPSSPFYLKSKKNCF